MKHLRLTLVLAVAAGCGASPDEGRYVHASYDQKSGKLNRLTYDANKNGKPDSWSYMDGTTVIRVEIDQNEDGRIERWEHYGPNQQLEKVGLSRADDGNADAWAYQSADGSLSKLEISTRRDGTVTRIELYEKGSLARSEEDTDGDGVIDKWETFADGIVTSVAFDTERSGKPTRRLVYGTDGSLLRIETGGNAAEAFRGRSAKVTGTP